jgi:hypothetical protein
MPEGDGFFPAIKIGVSKDLKGSYMLRTYLVTRDHHTPKGCN